MKKIFLLSFFSILIFVIFAVIQDKRFNQNIESKEILDISPAKEDIAIALTQKLTYVKKNLRYSDEDINIMKQKFLKHQDSMDIIIDHFEHIQNIDIEFNATNYLGGNFDRALNSTRHLAIKDRGISFYYTDISTYLYVITHDKLLKALIDVGEEMQFATLKDGVAIFAFEGEFFSDEATLLFYHYENSSKDYLTNGISVADNWNIRPYGYNSFIKNYPENRFNLPVIEDVNRVWLSYFYFISDSEEWKEVNMKKKLIVTGFIIMSILCLGCAFYGSRMIILKEGVKVLPDVTEPYEKIRNAEKPDMFYVKFNSYYESQDDYQRIKAYFYNNKDLFEAIITETIDMEGTGARISYYLLGNDWKEQLEYIPDSEFLKDYEGYYFVFKAGKEKEKDTTVSMSIDEIMYRRISGNVGLNMILNSLGKSGEIVEIIFDEEGVWFQLTGPFFKEKVMAYVGYIYGGKNEIYTKECTDEMWIDEHWLLTVPYPCKVEDFDPYEGAQW